MYVFSSFQKCSRLVAECLGEYGSEFHRGVSVGRSVGAGTGRFRECVNDDMKLLGLQPVWNYGYVERLHIGANIYP